MRFLQAQYDEVKSLGLCHQLTAVTQLSDERASLLDVLKCEKL